MSRGGGRNGACAGVAGRIQLAIQPTVQEIARSSVTTLTPRRLRAEYGSMPSNHVLDLAAKHQRLGRNLASYIAARAGISGRRVRDILREKKRK
jgi:hypothetical protein